ncbi:hypothetical protein [Actinomadura sp. B10D3]|uniref:hypothetical protein n=1 Tax=Actinomadura sp. B10D3 TaxID=3153557 RepID=UPI00325ECEDF
MELNLVDVHPVEGLRMLRDGRVDVALVFRHADTPDEEEGFRLTPLLQDPLYLITREPGVHATEIEGGTRRIFAVTYGEPPDPPATAALIEMLVAGV